MPTASEESPLHREVRETGALRAWVRAELYTVDEGGWRAAATGAVAAAAAARTYRLMEQLPEWQNDTSAMWEEHLQRVWDFLRGDESQHYALSKAVADYLISPLNHIEGQDGPNDFDRPHTIASYCAALSCVAWGVDFAVTAVGQIFDCIDLSYDSDGSDDRWDDVQRESEWVRKITGIVVASSGQPGARLPLAVLDAIRL